MVQPYDVELLKRHFPSQRDQTPEVFELALVCCGGISAGAYVAGVLDFLWEAFEEWRAAAAAGTAPKHDVRVRYLVGASAGGLGLGLASLATIKAFPHVYDDRLWAQYHPGSPPPPQPKAENPAWRAWVREITLERLLSKPEEVRRGQVYLFHGAPAEICDTVLAAAIAAPPANRPRDWVCDPLELRATIGNLMGVPYELYFSASAPGAAASATREYLTLHRDNIAFSFDTGGVGGVSTGLGDVPDAHVLPRGAFDVPPPAAPGPLFEARRMFRAAMVATSAVPLVFEVITVPQTPLAYVWRGAYWDRDRGAAVVNRPAWRDPPDPLDFAATDGGLFDNRPFTVAHERLAGPRGTNPQEGRTACRAVVLIDPLADDSAPVPRNPDERNIFKIIASLVLAPVAQDRMDTFNLAQINDEDIHSRFMIAPSRENPDDPGVTWRPSQSVMSEPLSAFLGFAAEAYREHDFLLGRRNAQKFLRDTFVLPIDNPLVRGGAGWLPEDETRDSRGARHRRLVPLRGRAKDIQPAPAWPWLALTSDDIDRYVELMRARLDAIFDNLKTAATSGGGLKNTLLRVYLELGWSQGGRDRILDGFRSAITKARDSLDPAAPKRNLL